MTLFNQRTTNIKNSRESPEIRRVGITGASGSLGKALSKVFRSKGFYVIGLTHRAESKKIDSEEGPNEWLQWSPGKEKELETIFETLDLLVLNHGINPQGNQSPSALTEALEVNALSTWRLIESFQNIQR